MLFLLRCFPRLWNPTTRLAKWSRVSRPGKTHRYNVQQVVKTRYQQYYLGSFGYNYFWATIDENQIPRKLDENGDHLSDFNTHSFHNQTVPFPDGTFALPSYCNVDEPSNCPIQTACGEFRSRGKKLSTV